MDDLKVERSTKRADAQRNAGVVLEVAIRLFREQGVDVPLDIVAKEAGVGSGTLYRHFPNREALLAAALLHKNNELIEAAKLVAEIDDVPSAIDLWIIALQDYLRTFNGLPNPLLWALDEEKSPLSVTCDYMLEVTGDLIRRGVASGTVRREVTPKALFQCILGTSLALNYAKEQESGAALIRSLLGNGYLIQNHPSENRDLSKPVFKEDKT